MRHSDGLRAAVGGSVATRDANFKNTALLLHGDGTNGAQNNTFIDSSTNNFTITRNGNATQGTFSPFGDRWSNYFDGSGDSISAPSNAAFNLSSDFSIECWVYFNGSSPSGGGASGELLGASSAGGAVICVRSGTLFTLSTNATADDLTASFTFATGTWYHLVACRTGSTACLFINGTRVATGTVTRNYSQSAFVVFSGLNGYISNFRVIKGSNPYGTGSTLSVPTAPLTAVTDTSLLTCQSNRFVDNSTNNFTITPNGDVRVEKFNPFGRTAPYSSGTDGASGYFDGSGDYLSSPDSSALDLSGSTSWCIELWAYWNNVSGEQNLLEKFTGPTGPGWTLYKFAPSLGTIDIYGSSGSFNSGVTPIAGQWYHIVVCRDNASSRTSFFINGSRTATTTSFSIGSNASTSFLVGVRNGGTTFFNGYLSNPRVVKGSSVYDPSLTSISIPTAPLTAIANTSLLLNFTNAGVIDNTGLNVLETVGNAQLDTGIKKFGTGSLEFDGTGDYLTAPNNPAFSFGTGDFTVECWLYLSQSRLQVIWDSRASGPSTSGIAFAVDASNNPYVFVNGSTLFTSSTALTTSTWNHLAFVKSSGTITLYINGVKPTTGSAASSTVLTDQACTFGTAVDYRDTTSTLHLNGYIDDFRITNGLARYTANFTPPTAPFADF